MLAALSAILLGLGVGALTAPTAVAAPTGAWAWDAPGWGWERRPSEGVWYTSPHGTHLVPDNSRNFLGAHTAAGGGRGQLGYPTGGATQQTWGPISADGVYQTFERGAVYGSYGGTWILLDRSAVTRAFRAHGGGGGTVGYPTGPEVEDAPGWWSREFANGAVLSSRFGTWVVPGNVADNHRLNGGRSGLGYPTGPAHQDAPGFRWQQFERAVIYCRDVGGPQSCKPVQGGFLGVHARHGGGRGALGYPTTVQQYSSSGSWSQHFERGTVTIFNDGRVVIS